jgi:HAD superfamily hydrolase (TIGR01509 family)
MEWNVFQAVLFDLDGTLVQTERLKAISYAQAAIELCPRAVRQGEVLEAFKQVVGQSRREVSLYLMRRFDLGAAARALMEELGVDTPWQAFAQRRLQIYERMLDDPEVLREHRWPHTLELLRRARTWPVRVGLATMSHCVQARHVLEVLELTEAFDFVATRDDVENPKPDPEIYELVARELEVPPAECLVIEDSPTGVRAGLAAGMAVIAVSTPFTRERLHEEDLLDARWIVDDPKRLPEVVQECLEAHSQTQQPDGGDAWNSA